MILMCEIGSNEALIKTAIVHCRPANGFSSHGI